MRSVLLLKAWQVYKQKVQAYKCCSPAAEGTQQVRAFAEVTKGATLQRSVLRDVS